MARSNLQIKVGTYTGNGADATNISGVGFRPDFVLIKGGANIGVLRTREITGDKTAYAAGNTANEADNIQEILNDGFQLGTNAKVNANGTVYYYVAIRGTAGQSYFRTGKYIGTSGDSRNYTGGGLNFTPDFVFVKGDRADNGCFRTSAMGADNSAHLSGSVDAVNEIQSLISNGFQLGTSTRTNLSAADYYFVAMKALAGCMAVGTYTGNATDNRSITGLGFSPDVVIIKNGTTTNAAVIRTSSFSGDSSTSFGSAGPTTDMIQSFISDGFTIGANVSVNGDTNTFWWIAFKAGNFNVPITRTAA